MIQVWQDILSTALVGTERQALTLKPGDKDIDLLLRQIDADDRERQVLAAAGILTLWRRAGQRFAAGGEHALTPACDRDDLPRCSSRSAQHLRLMLDRLHESVLPEWLAAAAHAGKRVPEEFLPEILELGNFQPSLRLRILPVLGTRGRWLAAQNPEWRYAASRDPEVTWQTGDHDERLFLLKRLRSQDASRARELLASTWQQESAQDRTSFIATLSTDLTMDDEPFLEAALDDRSKEARRTAAELLAHLPESRLVQRMTERAQPLLTFHRARMLSPDQIDVAFPPECTKDMIRDGIDPKPPAIVRRVGTQAWQLMQILSAVPPSYWSGAWGQTPRAIVAAANRNEWRLSLLEAWALAAHRQRDVEWAEALLRSWPTPDSVMEGLIEALPRDQREAHALDLLESDPGPLRRDHPGVPVLQACTHTWAVALSLVVLDRFKQTIAAGNSRFSDWELRSILASIAEYIAPEVLEEASTGWPKEAAAWPEWEKTVEEFLALVQFRYEMVEALQSAGDDI